MSRYDAKLGRSVYSSDFGDTVDFTVDDSVESVARALDDFYTVHIGGYFISCDDFGRGVAGDSYIVYLPGGRDFHVYFPEVVSVVAILEGIRTGNFDPEHMI